MSFLISNTKATELFATQTTTKLLRVRAIAAALAEEYAKADSADQTAINAIVDELLVLTP